MSRLNIPLVLFTLTMSLVCLGIVAVYSASTSTTYLAKQLLYAMVGLVGMAVCYLVDYRVFKRLSTPIMVISFILCCLVFVPGLGVESNYAKRWIKVVFLTIQPSEFAKLALILYMAKMLSDRRPYIKSFFSGLMPAMIITGLFACIIVIEPDFGAAFVLCLIIFAMWFAAEMSIFHLTGLVVCSIPAVVVAFLLEPYRWARLMAFIVRDKETIRGAGYQLHQSLVAVGSGGLWGLGLGESRQKFFHLSEAHTDFIFAIVAEELGFARTSLVVAAFAALTMLGWRVAMRTPDLFGSLLAAGITLMIFIGASINMAVVLGLLPTKGLVLPFISAGGSSLIVCMSAMGLLMNIARNQHAR